MKGCGGERRISKSLALSTLLKIQIAQIGAAIEDLDAMGLSVFDGFAKIGTLARNDPATDASAAVELAAQVDSCIRALQGQDRIEQRLQHVVRALEQVDELIACDEDDLSAEQWRSVRARLRAVCTMEAERDLVDALASAPTASV